MGYVITDGIGLIIASLNTATFITLVYVYLKAVETRSRLFHALDKVYGPVLAPLRRILPAWKLDVASLLFAAALQAAAFGIKQHRL